MAEMRTATTKSDEYIQSFEIVGGGKSGDLISKRLELGGLKVGLLATGYFEFFRMYPGLGDKVKANMDHIAEVLAPTCDLVYPGFIQTLDESNDAGMLFRKECVDVIIIAEGTYNVIAMVVIGGCSLSGGKGTVLGTILGILLIQTMNNSLALMNIPTYWQKFAIGAIMIIGISMTAYRTLRESKQLTGVMSNSDPGAAPASEVK